ncbi:YlxR family protein [Leuconostocaceae bacterium ESL0723]|nr:YlxR family protein [Lactobacillaceae bacterium L1_55_11]WEV53988.1 YlxR family protein [Leuconostocaceae bacterium ESL0723]
MKPRKIPMRKDIVSGEMFPKKDLVRVVRNKEGEVSLDPTGKKNGRGAYISLDADVAKTAQQKHVFDKAFGVAIPASFYEELLAYVEHQQARRELFGDQ